MTWIMKITYLRGNLNINLIATFKDYTKSIYTKKLQIREMNGKHEHN